MQKVDGFTHTGHSLLVKEERPKIDQIFIFLIFTSQSFGLLGYIFGEKYYKLNWIDVNNDSNGSLQLLGQQGEPNANPFLTR